MAEPESHQQHLIALARDLLDDIELSRLSPEQLVLKTNRLARFAGAESTERWLMFELRGYNATDPVAREYMAHTGRWIDPTTNKGFWGSLVEIDSDVSAIETRLKRLGSEGPYTSAEARQWIPQLRHARGIRGRVLALIHQFITSTYYEAAFSNLSEQIFDRYKRDVDALLAERCGDVLQKVPSVYDRLSEGDREAISQALMTCRRIVDTFADAVYPARDGAVVVEGETLEVGAPQSRNRLRAYIAENTLSTARRKRLRQTLTNLYDRLSAGVHSDVTTEEARSLFLQVYLFLGEVLNLDNPDSDNREPRSGK
ncbi:MAG: hypothetical protein ABSA52_16460 [Candidatus Binatia bacterium]|jgi:hypothetical protein